MPSVFFVGWFGENFWVRGKGEGSDGLGGLAEIFWALAKSRSCEGKARQRYGKGEAKAKDEEGWVREWD